MIMPVSPIPCHRLLEYLAEHLVESLDRTVSLRVVAGGVVPLDLVLLREPVHLVGLEGLAVVGGDPMRYPKAIYDVSL